MSYPTFPNMDKDKILITYTSGGFFLGFFVKDKIRLLFFGVEVHRTKVICTYVQDDKKNHHFCKLLTVVYCSSL